MKEAQYYTKKQEGQESRISCTLCPNLCTIINDAAGICGVRQNKEGTLRLPFYGECTAVNVDPIEKKPLYHFYPGKKILSLGFAGCSFRCPFCQNYSISQFTDAPTKYLSPEDAVTTALDRDSFGIAYTYSEPTVHFEYCLDTSKLAEEKGIKNVLVTNGYLNEEPAHELLEHIDAANVDLKSFNSEFYKKEIGGKLEPVLEFIRIAAVKTSLEITTLIIPGKNDSREEMGEIASFIASLDRTIPLHLSCYYPTYKYTIPPTEEALVIELAEVAKQHLDYVYLGNVRSVETNTYCPECGALLIRRRGYKVSLPGTENGTCGSCGRHLTIPGV